MAKTLNDKLLEDVLSVYSDAEMKLLGIVAKHAQKGVEGGWAEGKLESVAQLKKEVEATLQKANHEGKQYMGEGIIASYVDALDGGMEMKKSTIDTSGITNKKLLGNIHKAFDFVKSMPQGAQDPDAMFKKVTYATGNMASAMTKNSIGAQVVGDTIYINKAYEDKIDDAFMVHEIGHKVGQKGAATTTKAQEEAAQDMAKKLGFTSPKAMSAYVSDYATKSASELYPEALMEYYKAVTQGQAMGAEKKKIVEALVGQMYNKQDPGKLGAEAEKTLAELNVPMNLKMGIMAVNGLLDKAVIQVIRNVEDVFADVQGKAMMPMLSGVDTRIQATQRALNEYAALGITNFVDKSGRKWNLASYAEMCARTTAAHAALNGHIQRQVELGRDLMKVSSIGATCPICAKWQGVVLSITGKTPDYKTIEQAKADGLFHPNCKHTLVMHIPELDGPGQKELNVVKDTDHSQVRNKLIEKQRSNERNIRYWKKRRELAVSPSERAYCDEMVKKWQYKNLLHCEKNNLRRLYYREGNPKGFTDGLTGPIVGGTFQEKQAFYNKVIGEPSDDVFEYLKDNYYYGAKTISMDKWLKDEITSLDDFAVELAFMKDPNNKAFTPTIMYKKYIGDDPKADWVALGGEVGTGAKYGKWLSDQVKEIGTGYKLKPSFVETIVNIDPADKGLSATQMYKKYHGGEAPTVAYAQAGGEQGTGMKYGKWIEQQKKDMIANGIKTTVPFNNSTMQQTQNVISQAKATVAAAKATTNNTPPPQPATVEIAIKADKLSDPTSSMYVPPDEYDEKIKFYKDTLSHMKGSSASGTKKNFQDSLEALKYLKEFEKWSKAQSQQPQPAPTFSSSIVEKEYKFYKSSSLNPDDYETELEYIQKSLASLTSTGQAGSYQYKLKQAQEEALTILMNEAGMAPTPQNVASNAKDEYEVPGGATYTPMNIVLAEQMSPLIVGGLSKMHKEDLKDFLDELQTLNTKQASGAKVKELANYVNQIKGMPGYGTDKSVTDMFLLNVEKLSHAKKNDMVQAFYHAAELTADEVEKYYKFYEYLSGPSSPLDIAAQDHAKELTYIYNDMLYFKNSTPDGQDIPLSKFSSAYYYKLLPSYAPGKKEQLGSVPVKGGNPIQTTGNKGGYLKGGKSAPKQAATTTKATTKVATTHKASNTGGAHKVSLGREAQFSGTLRRRSENYLELSYDELEKLAQQVPGHGFFKAKRADILGRDSNGKNHHMGHKVDLVSGLDSYDEKLGEAFQVVYDHYINKATSSDINLACIKGYDKATATMKKFIDGMDMAINSVELQTPIVTRRFITQEVANSVFGPGGLKSLTKGSLVENKAYMSATIAGHPTFGKRDIMMTIQTDKGTHVLPTINYEEGEFLYGRGGKLEIVDVVDHSKKALKLGNYDGSSTSFKGTEVVVRYIEAKKAEDYVAPTPTLIDSLIKRPDSTISKSVHVSVESKAWLSSIGASEKDSVKAYTGSAYTKINGTLRGDYAPEATTTNRIEHIRSALDKASMEKPVALRRGVPIDALEAMLGVNAVTKKVIDEVNNNSGEFLAIDPGFMSATPFTHGGFNKSVDLRIYCPSGTKAAYIAGISNFASERETLIQSGAVFRVLKLEAQGGNIIAHLELLGTD